MGGREGVRSAAEFRAMGLYWRQHSCPLCLLGGKGTSDSCADTASLDPSTTYPTAACFTSTVTTLGPCEETCNVDVGQRVGEFDIPAPGVQ